MTHQSKWYLMFPFCLAFRATDETDLLSLWTNHGNQSFPRQRIFICEVCGSFIIMSLSFLLRCTSSWSWSSAIWGPADFYYSLIIKDWHFGYRENIIHTIPLQCSRKWITETHVFNFISSIDIIHIQVFSPVYFLLSGIIVLITKIKYLFLSPGTLDKMPLRCLDCRINYVSWMTS